MVRTMRKVVLTVCFLSCGVLLPIDSVVVAKTEGLKLKSVKKIWDRAPHNAFTDLILFRGEWVCAFREAPAHAGGVKGSSIRVIASAGGTEWRSVARIDDPRGDIRDAKLAELPDGRLMLLTATQFFDTQEQRHQSHAWFSSDLSQWEGPHDVGDPDYWTWGVQFHKGVGYSIGYRTVEPRSVRLYKIDAKGDFDSFIPDLKVESKYPSESALVFSSRDTAYALLRCQGSAQFGVARAPYREWKWTDTEVAIGGPEMIELPDGRLLGGGRLYDGKVRTSLFWLDPTTGRVTEALKLPSGGDTSYPGFVFREGVLYVSYYSSHEGKSSIYFAEVEIPEGRDTGNQDSPSESVEIGNHRELFVAPTLIEELRGDARQKLHAPVDREVVFRHDQPWEGNTSTYHSIFHDGDRYRMYYRGSHAPKFGEGKIPSHPEFTCYAESVDGVNWERPNVGQFAFNGSTDNNIVLAEHPAVHNFAPFLDARPGCPPEQRFKAIGGNAKGLYAFQSADGLHWKLMQPEPVITEGKFDSLNVAFYDSQRKRYVMFFRDFRRGVRDIKTATSGDFLNWSSSEWLGYPGSPPEHLYTNGIVLYARAPHWFIGLAKRFVPGKNPSGHAARGVSDAVLMGSRDGKAFHRWQEAVIRPGLDGSRWVNRNNLPAWGIVETPSAIPGLPRELSAYTTGNYYRGTGVTLRRHTWRMDGFVSVNGSASGGELVTVPVRFSAVQGPGNSKSPIGLFLNLSTSAAGSVRVELQTPSGVPIPGYSLQDSDEWLGDSLAMRASWNGNHDVSELAGVPVRMRVVLRDADLFSFQFRESQPEALSTIRQQ